MRTVYFTYGYAFSRKSSAGRVLSNELMWNRLETRKLGRAESPEEREARYGRLFACARPFFENGMPVILDGTFGHPRWRNRLYELVDRHDYVVVCVHCYCEVEEVLERRRAYRSKMEDPGEKGCYRDRAERAYDRNPLEEDDRQPDAIIQCDSGHWTVGYDILAPDAAEPIRDTLDETVSILDRALGRWRREEEAS